MEEEDFVITVNTSISTSINNLNHKTIQPYYLKYKNIKNIADIYSRLVDVFGDIKSELAEFYNTCVNINETSLIPCFKFKEEASFPLRDGYGIILDDNRKYTQIKNIKFGSKYIIVNFKDVCNENDKEYEELRHILIRNENNKEIVKNLKQFADKNIKIINISANEEYNIKLNEIGITKTIINIINSMHKIKNYKIGINSDINSLMEGKYFDIVMNYDDIKSVAESRKKEYKNSNNIDIIKNILNEYYLNIYDDTNFSESIKQKINDYLEKFTKIDQTSSIEISCPHKLLIYNIMYSNKTSKFNIKKNAKKLEDYYDNMYNREQMIICNSCGENMICPHNIILLKMIDDSEFNKKNAISNYIIYNRKQKTAVCKICKSELFDYDSMQSMEYYSLDDYIYKEMADDKLYKLIYKYINIYIRLPSITTNETILTKKDVIDMCIPCIYQITQTNLQNYLKNNILSNEMKNDVLNIFAMIYCAAFINILSKKLKTTKGGFIILLDITGNIYDILTNMYNQFISLNKNTHAVEYSQIYNEAITNIHSNIGIILNYIKNSKTNKLRQNNRIGLNIKWNYLIPDKRIFVALDYDAKIDGDLFFNSMITNKDVYNIINIYPKNYQKDFILINKDYYYFDYNVINSNKYKNNIKPPLYILYDLNGDKHDFKRDNNGIIKCSVCGWDYKNIEKYSTNLDKIINIIKVKQFLAKIKKFCPVNISHTYSSNNIECSACGYISNWDINSTTAVNYYNKYKDKLDKQVMAIIKQTNTNNDLNQKYYIEKKNIVRDIILKNNTNSKLLEKILNENKNIKSMFDKIINDDNYLISVILYLIRILSRILNKNTLTDDDDEKEILNIIKNSFYNNEDESKRKIIKDIIIEKNEICNFNNIILASNDNNIFQDMNFFIMYLKGVIYNIFAFVISKLNLKILIYTIKVIYNNYIKYTKVYNKKLSNNDKYNNNLFNNDDEDNNNTSANLEDSSNEFIEEEENKDNLINEEDNEDLDFRKDEPEDYENGRFLAGLSKEEE